MSATRWVGKVCDVLLETGARTAVKYLSPTEVVQATRIAYDGRFSKRVLDIRITIGRPNYLARRFVKSCQRAGEPFPVKKIQLRFPRA